MKSLIYTLVVAVGILMITQHVKAGPLDAANNNLNSAIGTIGFQRDLGSSIGTVVKALLSVVGTIFLLLTIYAGVLWMTAQGNEEKAGEAQGIIRSAVIGLFVVMAAYAITAFVTARVGGVSGGSTSGGNGNATNNATTNGLRSEQCQSMGGGCIADCTKWGNGYKSNSFGPCNSDVGSNLQCCELKDSTAKCNAIGGTCNQATMSGYTQLFSCDFGDGNCWKK